jgi:hypothetical protein
MPDLANIILQSRNQRSANRSEFFDKLMQAAQLGKSVWETLNEKNKYKEGSDYWNYNEHFGKDVPLELAQKQGEMDLSNQKSKMDYELQNNKSWLDYQNANPGKPSDQLYAEWLSTDAGKQFLEGQQGRETSKMGLEHRYRMEEINAGKSGSLSDTAWTAYSNAIKAAQERFLTIDDAGNPVWKQGVTPDVVRNFLYGFAKKPFVSGADVESIKQAFDLWVSDPTSENTPAANTPSKQPDLSAIYKTIQDLIAGKSSPAQIPEKSNSEKELSSPTSPMSIVGGGMAAMGSSRAGNTRRESELERGLKALIDSGAITGTPDLQAAKYALSESSRPGFLSDDKYIMFLNVLDSIRNKYGGRLTK